MRPALRRLPLAALLALAATAASAHPGHLGGLGAGLSHPLTGADHLVAMVAVGLWAARAGGRAAWALPLAFPVAMTLGAVLALAGVALPGVEAGIALSGVVLGLCAAAALRAPLALAAPLVGAFALLHGHAHGTELPLTASPALYALGFVAATAALHGAGVALVRLAPARVARGAGLAAAAVGALALAGLA